MTWNTFHQKAQQLGFEVACQTRTAEGGAGLSEFSSPPRHGQPWVCVGSYGHAAGLWAQPLTEQARALSPQRVAAMIAGCCEFVGTLADHDDEFDASLAPLLAAVANPEYGRMPA